MANALAGYAILPLVGWASGINLYLTTAILGIGARAGWLELPAGLDAVKHPLVIGLAILLYAVEFVADKVPYVDSLWDSFHTFIRPGAAGAMGYLAGVEGGALASTSLALLTGTIALNTHAVKASTRLAINAAPTGVANAGASVAEDAAVVGMFWFFIQHPWIALALIVLTLVLSYFILRALWSFVAGLFKIVFRKETPREAAAEAKAIKAARIAEAEPAAK